MVCISLRGRPCGGDKQFGVDHGPDTRHGGDHQIEQFFQPGVGLNELSNGLFYRFLLFLDWR